MFDIDFYMRHAKTGTLERNENPVVYNIETTNACNMTCQMCPRTTLMTRPVETMEPELFEKIVDQLKPHDSHLWKKWVDFVKMTYAIYPNEMSENHFFLYVIPKVIQLHGYGDPLLDKNMGRYVKTLTERGFQSYFSCNPANIDIDETKELFRNGLTYIKYSIESLDPRKNKKIRGKQSDVDMGKIWWLLEAKAANNYKTTIIITMLNLGRSTQCEDYEELKQYLVGTDVYHYLKSQDTQWYTNQNHGTKSIHWSEPCKHPWMSMTIKSNGEACQCMEDFNNVIVLGDTHTETLYDIWNGEKYEQLRRDHLELTPGIQCTENCDMELIGDGCLKKTAYI